MSANVPVILFTPFSVKGYNTETIKAFYQMEKNKIYFRNYKRAATFINKNWENIDNWWFRIKLKEAEKISLIIFQL